MRKDNWCIPMQAANSIAVQNNVKRFRTALFLLTAVIFLGTTGYQILEGWSFLDSLYMTVITVATVGFREVKPLSVEGKILTIAVTVLGVTAGAWALGVGVELLVSEEIYGSLFYKRMLRTIQDLKDHYIICGFGRMGKQIAQDFARQNLPFVVVEDNPEQIPFLKSSGYLFVEGDATNDSVLKAAGVTRAKGLIAVASSDPVNVFIVLTARELNPNLYIVARSVLQENEGKLLRAGADKVVSPYVIGGHRIAAAVLNPVLVDFLDKLLLTGELSLQLGEARIAQNSPLIGTKLGDQSLNCTYGITVVAVRKSGFTLSQPNPNSKIEAGDTLIVIGSPENIQKFISIASGGIDEQTAG
ncbi:MAG: potassium channel family protein [Armatimonadota bacterium]